MKRRTQSVVVAVSAISALSGLGGVAAADGTELPDPLTHPSAFKAPPNDVRPRMRWWWGHTDGLDPQPFSGLSVAETQRETKAIADAGFGGAEIAFNPGNWADEAQRDNLQAALEQGRASGIKLDMTMGASWPIDTPATTHGTPFAAKELQYGRRDVAGGTTFSGAVPAPYDDAAATRGETLVAVTAARVDTPGPPVTEVDVPPATSTVLSASSLVDLTDRVSDGQLEWTAPDGGTWIVFAFWSRDSTRGVMDHFSADAAGAATGYLDSEQLGGANAALLPQNAGSFFEDSLEINAEGLFWTPRMEREFEGRRGYAMAKYLPLMFQQGMNKYWVPETPPPADFDLAGTGGDRVRHDYYETLTDLYVDDHIDAFADWASDHGMRYRTQAAFGQDLDAIRSAREVVEAGGLADDESLNAGDDRIYDLRNTGKWRFALDHHRNVSSGSHQAGSTEISSELGAVFGSAYEINQADLKGMMDKEWAGGSTRPMVHGFSYQSAGAAWPGNANFGTVVSDGWNDRTWPQWQTWKPLNDYWARGTYVLQSGTPQTDVAVYRDGFITTAAQLAPQPEVMTPLFDGLDTEKLGYSIGYVDPAGLTEKDAGRDGVLYPKGPGYRALVLDQRALPADAAEAIAEQAEHGLAVVLVGGLPDHDTSYEDRSRDDRRVQEAVARIVAAPRAVRVATQAETGSALQRIDVQPATKWLQPRQVYAQHRRTGDTDYFYLYNASSDPVEWDGSFAATGRPYAMDLWSGDVAPIGAYDQQDGRTTIHTRLEGLGTTVIAFRRGEAVPTRHLVSAPAREVVQRDADSVELRDVAGGPRDARLSDGTSRRVDLPQLPAAITPASWTLHVDAETPSGTVPHDLTLDTLEDWRQLDGLGQTSGVGTYAATVDLPAGWTATDRGTYLRLGTVSGSVRVSVNGHPAGDDSVAGRDRDVSALLHPGRNEIRIVLATTLRNGYTAANPGQTTTDAYGLLSPVQLVPFGRADVDLRARPEEPAPPAQTPAPAPAPVPPSPPGPVPPKAAPSPAVRLAATRAARSRTLSGTGVLVTVRVPVGGTRRIRVALTHGRSTLGVATRTVRKAGSYRLRIRANARGRRQLRALRAGRSLRLGLTASVRIDGRTRTSRRTILARG